MTKDKWFELGKIVLHAVVLAVAGYFGIRMGVPSTVTVQADSGPAFVVTVK